MSRKRRKKTKYTREEWRRHFAEVARMCIPMCAEKARRGEVNYRKCVGECMKENL